jgi:hypothetical protein
MSKKCEICGIVIGNLKRHISNKHKNITYKEYFFKYLANYKPQNNYIKCEICNTYHKDINFFSWHLKNIHELSSEEYYLKYILKQSKKPKCLNCGKESKFRKLGNGYTKYCNQKCQQQYFSKNPHIQKEINENIKKSNFKKHGVEHISQLQEIKEKIKETYKKTMQEQYGVDNYFQTNEFKQQYKKTCLKKYNTEYPSQNETIKEKTKLTLLKKYGKEYYSQTNKFKQQYKKTCLEKYGTEYYTQSKNYLNKSQITNFKKSKEEKDQKIKKIKQTCLEKYDCIAPAQNKEIQEKIKQTCLDKYGTENVMHSKEIQKIWQKNIFKRKEYLLPSNEYIKLQGYEPKTLDVILQYTDVFDINFNPKPILYYYKNKKHYYFPDFYIISLNLIIETKSTWILNEQGKEKNNAKFEACKNNGFNFLLVLDNNHEELHNLLKNN